MDVVTTRRPTHVDTNAGVPPAVETDNPIAPMHWVVARWRAVVRCVTRPWQHLSIRITATVGLSALLIMALAHVLHVQLVDNEMQPQIGKQLFATVTRAADDVDSRIERRQRALEAVAFDVLSQARKFDARSAQEFLNSTSVLNSMFEHVLIVGADGHVLADRPRVARLRGTDVAGRDYFVRARDTGRFVISEPLRTQVGDFQVVAMAVPLVGPNGEFGGVLVGSLNLVRSGLFTDIREAQIGDTGYFSAVTLTGKVIVHPDLRRTMQPVPSAALDPGIHRALAGWNGWQVEELEGVPALAAYKRLKNVPWVMVAVQPSAEAFAPLIKVDRVLAAARTCAVVVLALLVWVVVKWALTPLARLRDQINELEDGRRTGAVTTRGPKEIAVVANAFNRLNDKQRSLGESLAEREAFHRTLNDRSPVGVFLIDNKGQLTYCNSRFEQMIGRSFERICGWQWAEAIHEEDRALARERWLAARWARQGFVQEFRLVHARGEIVWVRMHNQPMGMPAKAPEYLVVALDVTAEREATERLRSEQQQGHLILETIREALVVVGSNGRVRDMTRAAEQLTGWPRDKANGTPVGRVVRVFDAANVAIDVAEIVDDSRFRTEDWTCETANGARIAVELVWQCFNGVDGSCSSGGVLSLRDITERRRAAERIAWAAAHDPLTGLKNRRSFEEALAGAHGQYLRSGSGAAVVMLDLDLFKQVNDRGGHDAGDEMLRLVTAALSEAVRTSDIAARLGGDEFALLLPGCSETRAHTIAESIRAAIGALTVVRGNRELKIGASFGISYFAPADHDWTAALQRADAACYEAKNGGRNTIRIGDPLAPGARDTTAAPVSAGD